MKKYLSLTIIIIFVFFINSNVFAREVNISSTIKACYNCNNSTYYGTEIANSGTENLYSIGIRYTGQLSRIRFYTPYSFSPNLVYTITLNMATDDWRNHFMGPQVYRSNSNGSVPTGSSNWAGTGSFSFVSMKKIKFTFTPTDPMGPLTYFNIYSTNISSTAFTGVSNWYLYSVILDDPTLNSSSGGVGTTPTPTPTPVPTSNPNAGIINNATQNTNNIINNQNDNTNSIINNQNNNTSDIIENNNENTNNIIDNQNQNANDELNVSRSAAIKNCINAYDTPIKKGYRINTNDELVEDPNSFYTPDYITIGKFPNTSLVFISTPMSTSSFYRFIVYDSNKNILGYVNTGFRNYVLPNNAYYFRFSTPSSDTYVFSNGKCVDSATNAINEVNNTISNPNIDSGTGSDFFDDFNNDMHGLSSIITIPLSTIRGLTQAQCSALHIPIPFTSNKYLDLPCMTTLYQQHIPTLLSLIQVCWYGLLSYKILVNIFSIVKGFKDPDSDKIEVMEL